MMGIPLRLWYRKSKVTQLRLLPVRLGHPKTSSKYPMRENFPCRDAQFLWEVIHAEQPAPKCGGGRPRRGAWRLTCTPLADLLVCMARKTWIINNPEKYRALRRAQGLRAKERIDLWFDDYKATHPCACGETDPSCLEFHHADAETKSFSIGARRDRTLTALKRELEKCEPICANCHRKGHAGRPSCARHVPLFKDCQNHWVRRERQSRPAPLPA